MKKLTDSELSKKISKLNQELNRLQEQKKERENTRKIKLAEYIEKEYNITSIIEFETYFKSFNRANSPHSNEIYTAPSPYEE
ncbi:hypothetical protein [Veillonella criceti]|uniref:Uncharacterized protein n=1 Tax=Veillonella criceti TaxID=103891 RepID=A0A380NM96_9FIRM|nr:hypothetical protein [Veillonella criceti]SUP42822.1 Uncharacterised protein [Veillonella criceti]